MLPEKVSELTKLENVIMTGDLSKLSAEERGAYVSSVCNSLGLNPLTRPFEYITLNGKLTLYAKRDATDQLRSIKNISVEITDRQVVNEVYVVTAKATDPKGRADTSIGAVSIRGLSGDALANAFMKAECVPLDYEILTKDGFKHPLEVSIGELVASVNHETHQISWDPIEDVSIYEDQEVTMYGNSCIEFEITPDHSWMIETNNKVRKLVPFSKMKSGNYIVLSGKDTNNDGWLTENEAALLGLIFTDGTLKKYKGKYYRASVCQSKPENFEFIDWATSCFGTRVSTSITDNRGRNWLDQKWWNLSKEQTESLLNKARVTCLSDLPRVACNLGLKARQAMQKAMEIADSDKRGTFGKGKIDVITTYQILCALNGFATSKIRTRIFKNSSKPFFHLRKLSYNRVAYQNLEKTETRITTVWCPTTKNGTWICKTDFGQVFVTGNTKAKRRVTLSICGLGLLDETEVETITPKKENVYVGEMTVPIAKKALPEDLGDYVCTVGNKINGKKLREVPVDKLAGYVEWIDRQAKPAPSFKEFASIASQYLKSIYEKEALDQSFPFEVETKQ